MVTSRNYNQVVAELALCGCQKLIIPIVDSSLGQEDWYLLGTEIVNPGPARAMRRDEPGDRYPWRTGRGEIYLIRE